MILPRTWVACLSMWTILADGPTDNVPATVRPVPPPGIAIPEDVRAELETGVERLRQEIGALSQRTNAWVKELLPDVQIFRNAVDYALRYDEFYETNKEPADAREMLRLGMKRADELQTGKVSWTNQPGLLVLGYQSKIDRSIQPYGLIVPPSFGSQPERPRRLDAWFHGRGEKLTELSFITGRLRSPGEFVPPDAFVLHLYGRYCNANKFAGEIDLLEALADVKRRYAIDEDRIVIRGFSMGGASCWQFAVHYPGMWAAAAPGAGFSETKDFLRVFQKEAVAPPAWEQKLWQWYDCPDYAVNLFNLPTVAYSGEIDQQKQAADVMAAALRIEGIELTHIIGPQTGHKYHPQAKLEIDRRIDRLAALGRNPVPWKVKFTTPTLRYNRSHWVVVQGLEEHWKAGRVEAEIVGNSVRATTTNISALSFDMATGHSPFEGAPQIEIDGQRLAGKAVFSDYSWLTHLRKENGKWIVAAALQTNTLAKRPGLQGPIDDAFMDSFIMVFPTGEGMNEAVGKWVATERAHATNHWRKQFRGEARVVNDTEVSEKDILESNLILWGDPESNRLLARIVDRLPISWTKTSLQVGDQSYPAGNHVPVMIFPNPLNPQRYVVLNSGFTFREYDYLNNARQVAKLPDYAVLDISVPPDSRYPGKVVQAGFFDERWQLK